MLLEHTIFIHGHPSFLNLSWVILSGDSGCRGENIQLGKSHSHVFLSY